MGTKFVVQEQALLMVMQIALKHVLKDDTLTAPLMEHLTSSVKSYLREECERIEDGKRADVSLDEVITKRAAIDALNHLSLYPGEWAVNGLSLCKDAIANLPSIDAEEKWQEIKETVLELRDNGGTATQKEVSGFLLNLMDVLDGEAVEDVKKVTDKNLPSADNDSLYQKLNEAHNEGYDVGYWAGRRDYEQKWIPCSERMPSEGENVLLSDTLFGNVAIGKLIRYNTSCCWEVDHWDCDIEDWQAWMPLPKPYETEGKEE